ncbi:S9 family peptidase [Actinoplanes sp. TBRC 11911]|uniref:S9 family peptidase n=1 Tax=Actinoplanes sp. TBRC 11911 TaxID=2729386 RepID=UPI001B7D48CB|nr:S9 family peptidase [Actinoplanes sp. TBRC 11911]
MHQTVEKQLRALFEPAFGRPSAIRDVHVSADGRQVVVTADVWEELEGRPRSVVHTVVDGTLRPLADRAYGARISPDGNSTAFLSDRERPGEFQLFIQGEPAPPVPGTIEYAYWSPDSRKLLLGVAGVGAELPSAQGSGTLGHQASTLPSWYPRTEYGSAADHAWRSLWTYEPGTGELTRVSREGLNCWEANWAGPDAIVAITSRTPDEDAWYSAELSHVDLVTQKVRTLLTSTVQLGLPSGSPDGRQVAVVQAVCSDRWVVAGDLLVVDTGTAAARHVNTNGTDVTRTGWIDSERLGFAGVRRLDSAAGVIDVLDGKVHEVVATPNNCGGNAIYPDAAFTSDGRVVTIQDSYGKPPQIVMSGPDGHQILASIAHAGTDHWASMSGHATRVEWNARDGQEIDGMLFLPSGDGPHPLILHVHGGPIWSLRDYWSARYPWISMLVARGYAVLTPNPRGSTGYGQAFAAGVVGDMGGADAQDCLSGIDAMVERGIADPARIGVIGASYGGYMASWLITQDTRFAAAVSIDPITDWYSWLYTSNVAGLGVRLLNGDPEVPGSQVFSRSPLVHASKTRAACLNIAGGQDRSTPPGQAEEFHHALVFHGVPSALVIYPEEGHGVRAFPAVTDFLSRIIDWFEKYLPAGSIVG